MSLKGKLTVFPKACYSSPDLTLTGSYEKCWKKVNNKWWLYKKGNKDEMFSELFSSRLARSLNINSAYYEIDNGYIRTLNFTDKYNFEPMIAISSDDDSYENVFNCLYEFDKSLCSDYLKLMWFDCLINNVDRHSENMGILRNKRTGKVVSLAPNFDNNIALLSVNSKLNTDTKKDGFISLFEKFLKNNSIAFEYYSKIEFPKLNKTIIKKCIKETGMKIDEEVLVNFLLNRYERLIGFACLRKI